MHFSCKITNAIVTDLETRGEDLSPLFETTFPHMEMLRDSSAWMSAPDMESFLETLVGMNWAKVDGSILIEAGHSGPKNRPWGTLDSVLRMMPRPQEILHQPDRFLSYFISPEPPIENLVRTESSLSFDLPLPAEQYPHVASYLKAAFEALPLYSGGQLARCEWSGIHLEIIWPEVQETIFPKDPGHQISPELLESVVADQQRLLRELEEKNLELKRREEELTLLRQKSAAPAFYPENNLIGLYTEGSTPIHVLSQNFARLQDYMVRAQQLITLLTGIANAKNDPAAKEVLRRLDWDYVKSSCPRVFSETSETLRRLHSRAAQNSPRPKEHTHV